MLAIGIKTGSFTTEIVLFENQNILSYISYESKNDEAEKLMPLLLELAKKHKIRLHDIKKVYVIKGPGSFTGLRVGVVVANTIAYLNKAQIYTLNAFDYWWTLLGVHNELADSQNGVEEKSELLLFAGSRGVYLSENSGQLGKLIDLSELKAHIQKKRITKLFGDISTEQKAILREFKFLKIKPDLTAVIRNAKFAMAKIVRPLYMKPPVIGAAAKRWNARKQGACDAAVCDYTVSRKRRS